MSWKNEIIRALLLAVGTTEIITNIIYLSKENGLILARKQHGELPANTTDKQIKMKIICMLFFGLAFFSVSLLSFILHTYLQPVIFAVLTLFAVYGIIEAFYYRHWKTCGFAFVTIVLFCIEAFI